MGEVQAVVIDTGTALCKADLIRRHCRRKARAVLLIDTPFPFSHPLLEYVHDNSYLNDGRTNCNAIYGSSWAISFSFFFAHLANILLISKRLHEI